MRYINVHRERYANGTWVEFSVTEGDLKLTAIAYKHGQPFGIVVHQSGRCVVDLVLTRDDLDRLHRWLLAPDCALELKDSQDATTFRFFDVVQPVVTAAWVSYGALEDEEGHEPTVVTELDGDMVGSLISLIESAKWEADFTFKRELAGEVLPPIENENLTQTRSAISGPEWERSVRAVRGCSVGLDDEPDVTETVELEGPVADAMLGIVEAELEPEVDDNADRLDDPMDEDDRRYNAHLAGTPSGRSLADWASIAGGLVIGIGVLAVSAWAIWRSF